MRAREPEISWYACPGSLHFFFLRFARWLPRYVPRMSDWQRLQQVGRGLALYALSEPDDSDQVLTWSQLLRIRADMLVEEEERAPPRPVPRAPRIPIRKHDESLAYMLEQANDRWFRDAMR